MIALRDKVHLLHDPDGLLSGRYNDLDSMIQPDRCGLSTMYSEVFSVSYYIEVLKKQPVWTKRDIR